MGLPSLDESKLRQLLELDEGKPALLREMAALFKIETPRRLQAIQEGLEAASAQAVMEAAHALKGASGLMGAQLVFALAREIEMTARSGELPPRDSAREAVFKLGAAVADAQEAIDYFLSNVSP